MIFVIDNYDSFTFNLVQYLGILGAEVSVHRNDKTSVEAIRASQPKGVLISPGPCTPNEAGISLECVRQLRGEVPILGVCLDINPLDKPSVAVGLFGPSESCTARPLPSHTLARVSLPRCRRNFRQLDTTLW